MRHHRHSPFYEDGFDSDLVPADIDDLSFPVDASYVAKQREQTSKSLNDLVEYIQVQEGKKVAVGRWSHRSLRKKNPPATGNAGVVPLKQVVILDIDQHESSQAPTPLEGLKALGMSLGVDFLSETFVVATPSKGLHVYLQWPSDLPLPHNGKINYPTLKADVRSASTNGYVVAPGSYIRGTIYEVLNNAVPLTLSIDQAKTIQLLISSPATQKRNQATVKDSGSEGSSSRLKGSKQKDAKPKSPDDFPVNAVPAQPGEKRKFDRKLKMLRGCLEGMDSVEFHKRRAKAYCLLSCCETDDSILQYWAALGIDKDRSKGSGRIAVRFLRWELGRLTPSIDHGPMCFAKKTRRRKSSHVVTPTKRKAHPSFVGPPKITAKSRSNSSISSHGEAFEAYGLQSPVPNVLSCAGIKQFSFVGANTILAAVGQTELLSGTATLAGGSSRTKAYRVPVALSLSEFEHMMKSRQKPGKSHALAVALFEDFLSPWSNLGSRNVILAERYLTEFYGVTGRELEDAKKLLVRRGVMFVARRQVEGRAALYRVNESLIDMKVSSVLQARSIETGEGLVITPDRDVVVARTGRKVGSRLSGAWRTQPQRLVEMHSYGHLMTRTKKRTIEDVATDSVVKLWVQQGMQEPPVINTIHLPDRTIIKRTSLVTNEKERATQTPSMKLSDATSIPTERDMMLVPLPSDIHVRTFQGSASNVVSQQPEPTARSGTESALSPMRSSFTVPLTLAFAATMVSSQFAVAQESSEVKSESNSKLSAYVLADGIGTKVSVPTTVVADDSPVTSAPATVKDALRVAGVQTTDSDQLSAALNSKLTDNQMVQVTRVTTKKRSVSTVLPASTTKASPVGCEIGVKSQVLKKGKNGSATSQWRYTYLDGVLSKQRKLSEKVVSAPVANVVAPCISASNNAAMKQLQSALAETEIQAPSNSLPNVISVPGAAAVAADSSAVTGTKRDWMKAAGIAEEDFSHVDYIISHESEWKVTAKNPSSGAYGLPQSLPGNKMASAGSDWETNPVTQLKWANSYVARYGGWAGAESYWRTHHWY